MARPSIRSEVFLREDIEGALQAIAAAHDDLAARLPQAEVAIYRRGFFAALRAAAAAFHVQIETLEPIRESPVRVIHCDSPRIIGGQSGHRLLGAGPTEGYGADPAVRE